MSIDEWFDPGGLEPECNLVGIKAYALSPTKERDPTLRDEASHMTIGHAEMVGEPGDVQQMR